MGVMREARARRASSAMDVSAAGRDLDPPDGFSVPYALRTILDELTMPAVVVRGGEPTEIDAARPRRRRGLRRADRRGGDDPHAAHRDAHLPDQLRVQRGELPALASPGRRRPSSGARRGRRRGDRRRPRARRCRRRRRRSRCISSRRRRADGGARPRRDRADGRVGASGGGVVSTASPAAAAVRLLARGEIEARGAAAAGALPRSRRGCSASSRRGVAALEVDDPGGERT